MKFTAFGGCADPQAAVAALAEDGVEGALYVDANDPQGIGLIVAAEDPGLLRDDAARAVQPPAVRGVHAQARVRHARPHVLDRLRARSRGHAVHEAARQDAEPREPLGRVVSAAARRRSFRRCRPIISAASWPSTARSRNATAPAGMPPTCASRATASTRTTTTSSSACSARTCIRLSAVVQEMRKTEQTAQYLDSLGPFFVGKAVWQAKP